MRDLDGLARRRRPRSGGRRSPPRPAPAAAAATPATAAPSRSAPPIESTPTARSAELEEGPQPGRLGALGPQRDRRGTGRAGPADASTSASPSVPTVSPRRPGLELHPGDPDALVGLDVRPERDPAGVEVALEALDVGRDAVHEHDQPGRVEARGQVRERDRRLGHGQEHTHPGAPIRGRVRAGNSTLRRWGTGTYGPYLSRRPAGVRSCSAGRGAHPRRTTEGPDEVDDQAVRVPRHDVPQHGRGLRVHGRRAPSAGSRSHPSHHHRAAGGPPGGFRILRGPAED